MKRSKAGFTLVELLVVIAIIGVLVALLLPAVQAAREAARRTECSNKMKQLGLALQNHHDRFKRFPPGGDNGSYAGRNPSSSTWGMSWAYFILPEIEMNTLYDQLTPYADDSNAGYNSGNVKNRVANIELEAFMCPSSDLPIASNNNGGKTRIIHYTAIAGSAYGFGGNNVVTKSSSDQHKDGSYGHSSSSGILYARSKTNMRDITDGTSNTMIVGEVSAYWYRNNGQAKEYRYRPSWAYGWTMGAYHPWNSSDNRGMNWTTLRWKINTRRNHTDGIKTNPGANTPLSSNHPGGVMSVFADGSVNFLPETIADVTLARLAHKSDGGVVTLP